MNQAPAGQPAHEQDYRPPYLAAAIATFVVWLLYLITLAPTTAFWDTSEYIATAHIVGVPHPPGNPLFVVLARAWEVLLAPTGTSVAVRINLFSATMSAFAHGFWFLMMHRVMAFLTERRAVRLVGAAVATLVSATAFTVWNQSNVNEKVYTVSLFTIALLSYLAFRWRDNLGQGKDDNLILLMVFILALSVGNHLMAFLAAPALVVFILLVHPRTLANWKLYALGAAVAVLGLSIHLFLPIRAALDPVINEADPSTMAALWESLSRQQYDKPSILANPTDTDLPRSFSLIIWQVINWIQYFDWQWARSIAGNVSYFGGARPLFTVVFAVLGAYGAWSHWLRDRISFTYMAVLFATLSIGLVGYLNFKYGYSVTAHPGHTAGDIAMHEVRERDYFFIVGFSVWGLWAGLGLVTLWHQLAEDLRERFPKPNLRFGVAAPVLAIALVPLALNWSWASRAGDYAARDWAYNLLMSVEPYGVLFTNGDNDTFPLWYLQEVEGIRRDVAVIVMSYLNTPWYAKQLRGLTQPCPEGVDPLEHPDRIICQRPFQPEKSAEFYEEIELEYSEPTRSILSFSPGQIDSIPLTYAQNPYNFVLERSLQFQADSLTVTIPGNRVLLPADVFMVNILRTALGDRPVYYAATTQAYDRVGLAGSLIRQGVAYKVSNGPIPVDEDPDIVAVPRQVSVAVGRHMDVERTDRLLREVFVHRSGIPDEWSHWVDQSTQNIPCYYGMTHYGLAYVYGMQGDSALSNLHAERSDAWIGLSQR